MSPTTKLLVACAAILSFGHAFAEVHNGPGLGSAGASAAPFTVSLRVEIQPTLEVGPRSLMPGETAHAGDHFTLTSWADQPVYLYVIGYEPIGWSRLLFPRSNHSLVQKGEPIRLPDSGNPFKLNNEPGQVSLYVYASRKPLDDQSCEGLRLPCPLWSHDGSRGGKSDKKEPPPPPPTPPGIPGKDRPAPFINNAKERFVSVKSDKNGTAVLPFTFKHAP